MIKGDLVENDENIFAQYKIRENPKDSFAMVHRDVIADKRLEHADFRLLTYLLSFSPCFPSINTIQKGTCISRKQIFISKDKLIAIGYLEYVPGNKEERRSNRYFVDSSASDTSVTITPGGSVTITPALVQPLHPKRIIKKENIKNINTLSERASALEEIKSYDQETKQVMDQWNSEEACLAYKETPRNFTELCLFLDRSSKEGIFPTEIRQAIENFQSVTKDTWMNYKHDLVAFLGLYKAKGIFRRFLDDTFHKELWVKTGDEAEEESHEDRMKRYAMEMEKVMKGEFL